MFTGIIQKVGKLKNRKINDDGSGAIQISCNEWDTELEKGESIAVNGVCLSLEAYSKVSQEIITMNFSVLKETLDRTTLSSLKLGSLINLERALKANSKIGGHFVTGHIDETATVISMKESGRDWRLEIECSHEILQQIVYKGSIAVDGVSLTIAELTESSFTVFLIPLTIQETSLGRLRRFSKVNIETDIIGKYVYKQLANYNKKNKIDMDSLI
ncbi:MAG TPA: riboflavin synthase, partial [Victivallales bacterium]|nr:riboflavin synthase [Victivallales bacterium]